MSTAVPPSGGLFDLETGAKTLRQPTFPDFYLAHLGPLIKEELLSLKNNKFYFAQFVLGKR